MDNWKKQTKQKILDFLQELKEVCLNCDRKTEDIKVLFATKYLNSQELVMFLDVVKDYIKPPILIGENRVQEAEEKIEFVRIKSPKSLKLLRVIMIGNLQKNKINKAINIFSEIHAVDSLELAHALNKRLEKEGKTMPVFLEVNVSGEESKHGFGVEEMSRVIRELRKMRAIRVEGLMTMAPYGGELREIRGIFRKLRELADRHQLQTSMGMSSDWKMAIEEGTDMIRIGSRIFN